MLWATFYPNPSLRRNESVPFDAAVEQLDALLPSEHGGSYTTKLTSMIELEGEWEVGLVEMSVPSRVENVVEGRCYCSRTGTVRK